MKHSVSEYHLAGGASGLVIHIPGHDVVSLQVRFNSGFQFADRSVYEVPHVMEHVLATVTQAHRGPNEFTIEAQKNGAYVNASTSVDSNGYIYEFADFELDRIVGLVGEQLTAPLFSPTSLKSELGNVREELSRNTTQHPTVCSVRLSARAYPHLWMDYEERIAQLPRVTIKMVEDYYRRTHTSANARFVVAGNFEDGGAALAKKLDHIFGKLPKGSRFERSREIGLGLAEPVVTSRDIAQIYYRFVMYLEELTEAERRAMLLLRLVLVGGFGSRIYGEARQRGLAYAVGGMGHAEPGNSSFGFIGYVTEPNARELFALIAREYAAVRNGGLTEAELSAAKDLLIGSIKRSTQTPTDLLSWYMDPYDESGEIRDFDKSTELFRKVRLDEVQAVADKIATANRQGMSFLGNVSAEAAASYHELLAPAWMLRI